MITRHLKETLFIITCCIVLAVSIKSSWREKPKNSSGFGEWNVQLLTGKEQQSCPLIVYAIFGELNCSETLIQGQGQINVTCIITKVFPEAICNLSTSLDVELTEEISYEHDPFIDKYLYYNTSCTFVLPKNVTQNITVTMYPNVTGNKTDIKYGKFTTFLIDSCNAALDPKKAGETEEKKTIPSAVIFTTTICFSGVVAIGITVYSWHNRKIRGKRLF
uniref:Polymorphic transmembrane cluster 2 transmembrane protein 8 n=1 Tax=Biomphalaria glabrata TaxID=6526 RepID=A0A2C9LBQ7_BIOGL|nr:polymorphic transmembrane cluster 2 transmembrane protein 8 [Biomphalaria glabrata]